MSNKHWCMPNYPFIKMCKEMAPQLKTESDISVASDLANNHYGALDKQQQNAASLELWLLTHKSPSLFIESRSLVKFLFESTYSGEIFEVAAIRFPFQWVVFPQMQIAGVDLRPVAFGHVSAPAYSGEFVDYDGAEFPFYLSNARHEFISGNFCKPRLADFINQKKLSVTTDYETSVVDIGNKRSDCAFVHKRLCAAAAVYATAFPDYVREGLPIDIKLRNVNKSRTLRAAPEILEGATRTSVSMHIRAGHFKTLRHERFKRNEDGTAKIIFVRQTVVAGKLTPKTAVGL